MKRFFRKLKHNTLFTGSAVYLISNVLNAAIPFALLPILTRYLTTAEYGEVAMFQTLLGALAAFVGLGLQAAPGRKFYDGNLGVDDLKEYIGSCIQIILFMTLITTFFIFIFRNQLVEALGLGHKWILMAALVTACSMIVQIRLGQWQVRKQSKSYGCMQVTQSFLNVTLSLVLVIGFSFGVSGRISGQVIAIGVIAGFALYLLKRDHLLKFWIWRPKYVLEALRFGVPLVPHVSGMFLLISVDRFVINSKLGMAETGIYMVAVQFAGALALVFDAINKAYVPWLFERLKRDNEYEKCQIVLYTYGWYVIILCAAGVAFLVGPQIVTFVAGKAYAEAGDVIGWLALGQVFGGMYLMVTNYIFFSKRTGLLSFATIFSGAINVALLLLLIGHFGLRGAAYAFCAAMALRFVLTWLVAHKHHPMPWFDFSKLFSGRIA